MRHRLMDSKGASAVEFALVLPVLIAILLGIAELGFLFNQQISLTQAAREGARAYAIHHGEAGFNLTDAVQLAAPSVAGVTASSSQATGACIEGSTVVVVVSVPYESLSGWFGFLTDRDTLWGQGAMRCGG
ncbi:TadE/TadG family type IV pilus assembly protein [Paeniglutamicibacter sulfureus]|uniref:Membrane protein YkvI n=1 Tax=Paeniglutamicibacter sulfureus TaxID=43666 RepID=A0ABU2BH85_9MICC|nr:pilus assembly protein [Paeniglutamicibacter sulfureus]MDR7357596.1 putative membrane protein YkvI [Paeniglutamicibacter sulfureus]